MGYHLILELWGDCASWRRSATKESDQRDMKEGKYKEPWPSLFQWGGGGTVRRVKTPGWNWVPGSWILPPLALGSLELRDILLKPSSKRMHHLSYVICWIGWDTNIQVICSLWQARTLGCGNIDCELRKFGSLKETGVNSCLQPQACLLGDESCIPLSFCPGSGAFQWNKKGF